MKACLFFVLAALAALSDAGAKTQRPRPARDSGINDPQQLVNDVGQRQQISYDLMREENARVHRSHLFREGSTLHVRHGLDVHLVLQPQKECDKPYTFALAKDTAGAHSFVVFSWTQPPNFQYDDELHYQIHVNRSIPVGRYALHTSNPCSAVTTRLGQDEQRIKLGDIFVMFNPHEFDIDANGRSTRQATPQKDEYIDNNHGYLWIGNGAIAWNYGVGSQVVTNSTDALMEMMTEEERSNKVLFSRRMSELVGNDVVRGRWDGRYDDGMDPTQWVGSADILSRWLRSRRPVRYGQCWVFAAVLTTVLRASGIPARSVTNYESHHDRGLTDDGTAVLRQYDNIVQEDESTWNFHVWSEAWLARPDLNRPAEWNAVDATPQEPSPLAPGEPYRAGPAYVPFIRANMRTSDYDAFFILAEVNAQKVCPQTGKLLPSAVGKAVVTKKPGMDRNIYDLRNPQVITKNYKIQSTSRRASDEETTITIPPPHIGCERDGGMRLSSVPSQPMVGEDFVLVATEGNVSADDTVVRMELMNYMGESLGVVRYFNGSKVVNVTEVDYLEYLRNSSVFKFTLGTYNESDNFEFHDNLRIRLEYEPLDVTTEGESNSSTVSVTVSYTNPLSIPMTGVVVSLSGPDHAYMRLEQPDIPANSPFTLTVEVQCGKDDGDVTIPVSLDSDETQSAYGMGWYDCGGGGSNGASKTAAPKMFAVVIMITFLFVLMITF